MEASKYTKWYVHATTPPFTSFHSSSPIFTSLQFFTSLRVSWCLFMALVQHLCSSASMLGIKNLSYMQDLRWWGHYDSDRSPDRRGKGIRRDPHREAENHLEHNSSWNESVLWIDSYAYISYMLIRVCFGGMASNNRWSASPYGLRGQKTYSRIRPSCHMVIEHGHAMAIHNWFTYKKGCATLYQNYVCFPKDNPPFNQSRSTQ